MELRMFAAGGLTEASKTEVLHQLRAWWVTHAGGEEGKNAQPELTIDTGQQSEITWAFQS